MANPRNLLRRRPLLALLVLILLLIIGYTARAVGHKHDSLPTVVAAAAVSVRMDGPGRGLLGGEGGDALLRLRTGEISG